MGETVCIGRIYRHRDAALAASSGGDDPRKIETLVDAAALLDVADDEAQYERGCYGAATAYAEFRFDADSGYERSEEIDDPIFAGLPLGSARAARRAIKRQRDLGSVWDGQNHCDRSVEYLSEVIGLIRSQ